MSPDVSDLRPEGGNPEFWQLNYMKGKFTDPQQMEEIVRNFAASADPDTLEKPRITLPAGELCLQLPFNRRVRSERESEKRLEFSDCIFEAELVLEAMHHHEETAGFRISHTVDYRKARLEREITIRTDKADVAAIDYSSNSDSFEFSALGTLYLPDALQGQVIADYVTPDKFPNVKFEYGGRWLPKSFTVYGGFHQPIYK